MTGSVIVAGARTPMGRLLGSLKDFSGADLGGVAIKGALEKAGVVARPGRLRDHGPGAAGRRRADPGPPGRRQGRHPDDGPGADHQQGLPVRPRRDRAGRPADPRRRVRHRRRRRHGVDDPGAAPPAEVPRGRQVRRRQAASTRWPTTASGTPSPRRRWARSPRRATPSSASPARSRTRSPPGRTSAPPRPGRTACSTTRSCRSRSRSARATRSRSRTTRASAPTRRPRACRKLRPAFGKDGTITAGSSSQISDGAAAVVVMSKAKAEELGLTWLAEIGAHGVVAGPDSTLQSQPSAAITKACAKEGISPADLDLVEINEAFASVGIKSDARPRPRRGQGQRQRRRDRARPPDRHVRRPDRAAPRPRAPAPRRRRRCGRALRRRRPGRRPGAARAGSGLTRGWLRRRTSARWSSAPGRVTPARSRG